MASAEASAYLSAVKWGDEGYYLREFTQKFRLPQVAKIIKGQYQNLGVPTLPSPALNQVIFLSSAGVRLKVTAQCVKFKDAGRRRMVPVGSKLAVPENYDGWFEILSEDGRSVRCIESVVELARKNPRSCLVREPIKVFLPRPEDPDTPWDKTRTLSTGEILMVGRDVTVSGPAATKKKFLRCVTPLGDNIFLPFEARSRFSAIAGEDNISGVHSVRTLMSKRFPLMVRLVHGRPPVGVKNGSQFVPEMRLYSLVEEESLVAMPLLKDAGVVPLPLNAALKVLAPRNVDLLIKLQEHTSLTEKCRSLMEEVSDCIQVCDVASVRGIRHLPPSPQYVYTRRQAPTAYRTIPLVKRSVSDPQGTHSTCRVHLERGMSIPADASQNSANGKDEISDTSESEDLRYEEIDQIYDYVRGFAPLPHKIKNEFSDISDDTKSSTHLPQIPGPHCGPAVSVSKTSDHKPPEPPPIETIPARKENGFSSNSRPPGPHKITVSIVNRSPSKTKDLHEFRKCDGEHIYEKIEKRNANSPKTMKSYDNPARSPLRSNSAGKIAIPNVVSTNGYSSNNRMFSKGPTQRNHSTQPHVVRQTSKCSFLRHSKNSTKEGLAVNNKHNAKATKVSRISKIGGKATIATSPLFHIRYKSLTDLLADSAKPPVAQEHSFSSSGKRFDGSEASSAPSSKEDNEEELPLPDEKAVEETDCPPRNSVGSKRLPRPKSLSNLIGDLSPRRRTVEHHNYYNLVQNDLIRVPELGNAKYLSMPETNRYVKANYINSGQHKKLGTLYL